MILAIRDIQNRVQKVQNMPFSRRREYIEWEDCKYLLRQIWIHIRYIFGVKIGVKRVEMSPFLENVNILSLDIVDIH